MRPKQEYEDREPLDERIMVRLSRTDRVMLRGIATERGSDESTVAREFIRAGLRGVEGA